jgi:hypothetical protein
MRQGVEHPGVDAAGSGAHQDAAGQVGDSHGVSVSGWPASATGNALELAASELIEPRRRFHDTSRQCLWAKLEEWP